MTATYVPVGCLPLEHTQAGWLLGEHPLRMLQMGATRVYHLGNSLMIAMLDFLDIAGTLYLSVICPML